MNPFTMFIDWLDEYADVAAPVGAFVGVAIAIIICFVVGGNQLITLSCRLCDTKMSSEIFASDDVVTCPKCWDK